MPSRLLNWALRQEDVRGPAKCVLLVLAIRAEKTDSPSLTDIASDSGLARSTVVECLNKLEDLEKIRREPGRGTETVYTLQVVREADQSGSPAGGLVTSPAGGTPGGGLVREADYPTKKVTKEINSPSPVNISNPAERDREFEEFWKQSSRKGSKSEARKAWNKIRPSPELILQISAAMSRWRMSDQWQDEHYIPHVFRWLNKEGWNDEILERSNGNGTPRTNMDTTRESISKIGSLVDCENRGRYERGPSRGNRRSLPGAIDLPFPGEIDPSDQSDD